MGWTRSLEAETVRDKITSINETTNKGLVFWHTSVITENKVLLIFY